MTPSLTITDSETGKAYNVPNGLSELMNEGSICSEGDLTSAWGNELYFVIDRYGLSICWKTTNEAIFSERGILLDPFRFTVSFPDSLSKEVVREVLDKHYPNRPNYINIYIETQREVVESIASDFDITLEETTNGN